MIKIKCPFCGSTSQPKMVKQRTDKKNAKPISEFECGCGCMFDVVLTITNVRLFDDEKDY